MHRRVTVLENENLRCWTAGDGVARLEVKPAGKVRGEDVAEGLSRVTAQQGGRPLLLLWDLREAARLDREARRLAGGWGGGVGAAALVVGSPLSRAMARFIRETRRPGVPLRLFSAQGDALAWLARVT